MVTIDHTVFCGFDCSRSQVFQALCSRRLKVGLVPCLFCNRPFQLRSEHSHDDGRVFAALDREASADSRVAGPSTNSSDKPITEAAAGRRTHEGCHLFANIRRDTRANQMTTTWTGFQAKYGEIFILSRYLIHRALLVNLIHHIAES